MKKDIFKDVRKEWGEYFETSGDELKKTIEEHKDIINIDVIVNDIKDYYKEFRGDAFDERYALCEEMIYNYELSNNFIQEVAGKIEKEGNLLDGFPISYLINNSTETDIKLEVTKKWDFLGAYLDGKDVEIEGDVASYTGYEMKKGILFINGNADLFVGDKMNGGEIIVKGYANKFVGDCMKKGKITINKSAGVVGRRMKSGEIEVIGDAYGSIGDEMKGGFITVKGSSIEQVGSHMRGGEIIIESNAIGYIGINMQGGKIKIYGEFNPKRQISGSAKGGEIYHKDELVWKDGKRI